MNNLSEVKESRGRETKRMASGCVREESKDTSGVKWVGPKVEGSIYSRPNKRFHSTY